MQRIQSAPLPQPEAGEWQVYQPRDQNQSVFKAFNSQIKNLLKLVIVTGVFYLVITLLSPLTLIVLGALTFSLVKIVKMKLTEIKKQGLINRLSEKWRQLLFEKSIFDIYCDLLYFPLVTKIIGAFIKPMIVKPHPQDLPYAFQQLPDSIQQSIARKGILSLAPESVQQIVFNPQKKSRLPKIYGKSTWQWRSYDMYQNHHEKVHQHTIANKIMEKVDSKVSWPGFMAMASVVAFGVYKMRPERMKQIFIQTGSFVGILMVVFIALVKLKKIRDIKRKQEQFKKQIEEMRNAIQKDD